MARTKATVRWLRDPTFVSVPGQRISNKNIRGQRNVPFKRKKTFITTKSCWSKQGNSQETEGYNFKLKLTYVYWINISVDLCECVIVVLKWTTHGKKKEIYSSKSLRRRKSM